MTVSATRSVSRGLLVTFAVTAIGCSQAAQAKKPPPPPVPMCFKELRRTSSGMVVRSTDPLLLTKFLHPDFTVTDPDAGVGALPSPPTDCLKQSLELTELPTTCTERDGEPPQQLVQDQSTGRITREQIVQRRVNSNTDVVWIVTKRYTTGHAEGPVSVIEFSDKGMSVRYTGLLRLRTSDPTNVQRARFRWETVNDHKILVADGEHCFPRSAEDPTPEAESCIRTWEVLVQQPGTDHLEHRPLYWSSGDIYADDAATQCVGPAAFHLNMKTSKNLVASWRREWELSSTVQFNPGNIVVHEQVLVRDTNTAQRGAPPRLFRRADSDRVIEVVNGNLYTSTNSLWCRMLQASGAVTVGSGTYDAGLITSCNLMARAEQ